MQMILNINEKDYRKIGIYKITNNLNGDFYIGSTRVNFFHRFRNYHTNFEAWNRKERVNTHPYLHHAFNKYGIENFTFEVLEIVEDKSTILSKEGILIRSLLPVYNICKMPEMGGCPNLGRKLSKEWKDKIAAKSSMYKHNKESLNKVIDNNKSNACIVVIEKENVKMIFNSIIEASKWLNCDSGNLSTAINKQKLFKGFSVSKIKSQKKIITITNGEETYIFNSLGECDRFLDMWRGYTSTMTKRSEKTLKGYTYEIL